jgi:hypothetical protein
MRRALARLAVTALASLVGSPAGVAPACAGDVAPWKSAVVKPARRAKPHHRLWDLPEGRTAAEAPPVLAATLGRTRVVLVDVDGNGVHLEEGVDGWAPEDGAYVVPWEPPLWAGRDPLEVRRTTDGRGVEWRVAATDAPVLHREALAIVNARRVQNGLPPGGVDAALSAGCRLHCLYCGWNGMTHVEEEEKRGYTAAGARAGLHGNLRGAEDLLGIATHPYTHFYHRLTYMNPGTRAFGFGQGGGVACIDGLTAVSSRAWRWPVIVPAPDTVGHPVRFEKSERPLPFDEGLDAGFPVTISFPPGGDLAALDARIVETGKKPAPVEILVSSPEKPAVASIPHNYRTICLIPVRPLRPDTTYEASVRWRADGVEDGRTWTFRTAPK